MLAKLKQPLTCKMEECGSKERWLDSRQKGICASDAAVVLGLSPYKQALELWAERTGRVEVKDASEGNERVKWGNRLEPVVADAFEEETGHRLHDLGRFTICRHPAWGFMFATLDRVIETRDGELGLLEIKTTHERNAEQWEDEPPLLYQVQLQHQLAVTGLQWGVLACLIGGQKLVSKRVERNDDFISILQTDLAKFWQLVVTKTPPETMGPFSGDLVQRLFPRAVPGKVVELPARFDDIGAAIAEQKSAAKLAKARIEELEAEFQLAIKDGEAGVTPAGFTWSWKNVERAGYVAKPTSFRQLRCSVPRTPRRRLVVAESTYEERELPAIGAAESEVA